MYAGSLLSISECISSKKKGHFFLFVLFAWLPSAWHSCFQSYRFKFGHLLLLLISYGFLITSLHRLARMLNELSHLEFHY